MGCSAWLLTALVSGACGARTGLEHSDSDTLPIRGETELVQPAHDLTVPQVASPPRIDVAPPDETDITPADEVIVQPPTSMLAEGECEAGDVLIYLVTLGTELFVYDPDQQELTLRGRLDCMADGYEPYSMAVNRFGIAYVLYDDAQLYRVDTQTLSCERTPYVRRLEEFRQFGMGFVRNLEQETDELFVTDIQTATSAGLARIDVESWDLAFIGTYAESVGRMEMTGSSDGQLYGYATDRMDGGRIVHIDKTSGALLEETPLPVGMESTTLAFAFFRGSYYVFTGNGTTTSVNRYDPTSGSLAELGTLDYAVVGAGVSTCDVE